MERGSELAEENKEELFTRAKWCRVIQVVWYRGACILPVRFHMYMYKPSFLPSAGLKGSIGFDTMLVSVMGRDTYNSSNFPCIPTQLAFLTVGSKAKHNNNKLWEDPKLSCNSYCVNLGLDQSVSSIVYMYSHY